MENGTPNSIDTFLQSLGVEVVQPKVQVMVMLSVSGEKCLAHCFVLEKGITEKSLEGKLLRRQWTFIVKDLRTFSEHYERMLDVIEVRYHRQPPMPPEPSQTLVTYELVKRLEDPGGNRILGTVAAATSTLHNGYKY